MFGFHKQQVIKTSDVVAVLKGSERDTLELQLKGSSYELKIMNDFQNIYNILEACRRMVSLFSKTQPPVACNKSWLTPVLFGLVRKIQS